MALVHRHGSFVFFIYVCAACLIGLFSTADVGFSAFWRNLFTVLFEVQVGAGVTVLVIDRFNEYRATESLKRRLTREAGSRSHDIAISAVEWMDREGWLRGEEGLLKGANLREARLHEARLEGANLAGANLELADLTGAMLNDANLRDANLFGAKLEKAHLNGANLECAELSFAVLTLANLHKANLRCASLMKANLDGAFLAQAVFIKANMREAEMRRACLSEYHSLSNLLLSRESYESIQMQKANWQGARLHAVDFGGVNLSVLNMTGADLSLANLRTADLRGTNLKCANLYGVLLEGAMIASNDTAFLTKWTEARDDNSGNELFCPKTDFLGATLPDRTHFTNDMHNDELSRFIHPNNDRFEETLARIKAIRQPAALPDEVTGS